MERTVGFFSSFNARHLDAEQVAKAFVSSERFVQLLAVQHSVLIGPRGSGKTHMLKMLQPKALNSWDHKEAASIRAQIPYWGIFVPADEAWRQQINSFGADLEGETQARYTGAMFTTHVARSVLDCFLQLTRDRPAFDQDFARVVFSADEEAELCRTLAHSWKLSPRVHSLDGVRQALIDRLAALYEAADNATVLGSLLNNCQTRAIQAVVQAISAFDAAAKRYEGRWCLMFDELEIAPAEIQRSLFRSLRSTDQRLLFKLAMSPSTETASVFFEDLGPTAGNDFDEISLYADPKESAIFCEALWANLAKGSSVEHMPPTAVLRHSTFHVPDAAAPYSKTGRWQEASRSLALKDRSYVEFLQHYELNPNALEKASAALKDSVVRKIGPIVGFRDFMLKSSRVPDSRPILRRDKTRPAALYSGWEAICLVSEGNPRWFTGIAKSLLINRQASTSGKELSREGQYRALLSAARKFGDYVATIPSLATGDGGSLEGGLKTLVNSLCEAFRNDVLLEPFVLDPVLSFEVDENTSLELRKAIFDGLYAGAFIPIGDGNREFKFTHELAGQKFRVTYLLAPLELLPLRSGKSRKLSTLLRQSTTVGQGGSLKRRPRVRRIQLSRDPQPRLFNE